MEMKHNEAFNQTEKQQLPGGWSKGDICIMITNRLKGFTNEYKIVGHTGKYFELRDNSGNLHHANIHRLFHNREEALASLQKDGGNRQ